MRGRRLPWSPYGGSHVSQSSLRGARILGDAAISVSQCSPYPQLSLRGGALFAPTWQSLVPEGNTNENEGTKREIASAHKTSLAMTVPRIWSSPLRHCEERSDEAISGTQKPHGSHYVIARP